ncbi:hypothetical protein IAT38_003116 [Cryptococcus sp. DSM 104549]
MSVELSPSTQLGFPRPFTQLTKRSLLIHNPHPHPVAFKVKTTAPKQYSVRPNSGRVEGGESVEVHIMLQPLLSEPPPHAKCKDKFLVQSAFITPDEEMHTLGEMWAQTEKQNKSAIHEQKLKVVYLAAEDGSTNAHGIPEEEENNTTTIEESRNTPHDGLTRWTTRPDKEYDATLFRNEGYSYWEVDQPPYKPPSFPSIPAPVQASVQVSIPSFNPPSFKLVQPTAYAIYTQPAESPAPANKTIPRSPADTEVPTTTQLPPLTAASAGVTNAALEKSLASTTSDSDKLAVALKEIEKLRADLDEARGPNVTGLRKRGGAAGGESAVEKPAAAVQAAAQQGVPLEVVVALVAGVFVLTYLFF